MDERKEQLEAITTQTLERLAEALAQGHTEEYVKLLAFWAKFHKYSRGNIILLREQKPDAEHIASYTRWKELGRQVAKGSTAAYIYAPILARRRDEKTGEISETVVNWKLVPVFSDRDLVDIDTNPLPSLFQMLPDDCGPLYDTLARHIQDEGIRIVTAQLDGSTQGASGGGIILMREGLPSRNALGVLVHEYAHELLHKTVEGQQKPRKQREAEAESTAYVVLTAVGIDWPVSVNYLTNWKVTPEELKASLSAIQAVVRKICGVLLSKEETTPRAA